jgi:hypothetical protein
VLFSLGWGKHHNSPHAILSGVDSNVPRVVPSPYPAVGIHGCLTPIALQIGPLLYNLDLGDRRVLSGLTLFQSVSVCAKS